MSKLDELRARLATEVDAAKAIIQPAADAEREPTGEEMAAYKKAVDTATATGKEMKRLQADAEVFDGFAKLLDGGKQPEPAGKGQSLGEQFVKSAEWQGVMAQFPGGRIPEGTRVQSAPVSVKTLLTGAGEPGETLVEPDRLGLLDPLDRRPLTIRSLVSVRTTTSDAIEYVRQTSHTDQAAVVAEATQTSGTSGTKPEGGFGFEIAKEVVKNIAEWIPATTRAVADMPQLMALINQELRADLAEKEEDEILSGDGTGEHFTGVLNTSGMQTLGGESDAFVATRKARTLVRIGGRAVPTAYVMNPLDWEAIDLLRDGNDRFFGAGPFAMSTPTLWGLPVVESEAMPQGTAIVADWRRAILWDREQATIAVSTEHADFFTRNMLAVRAEQRLAFGIIRPAAFVVIELGGSGNGNGGSIEP